MTGGSVRERRRSPRLTQEGLPSGTAVRLRAGHEACLINVSRHGILLESPTRLNPGQRCSLQWMGPVAPTSTSGVVIRAQIARRDAKKRLIYRAAIDFNEPRDDVWEPLTRPGNLLLTPGEAPGPQGGNKCPTAPQPVDD
jgi:hypothetical protein